MFTGIYLYWTKVPEISSRVPLSLAFNKTNSFHHLVAGNIKKGVSIFGITGSYYETKRYIIQNGQNTGLGSLTSVRLASWGKENPPGNLTYDNSTWVFLTGIKRYDRNRASNLMMWGVSYIPNIASIAKCTWHDSGTDEYGKNGTYSFGFRVRGDLLVWQYMTGTRFVFQVKVMTSDTGTGWGLGYNTAYATLDKTNDSILLHHVMSRGPRTIITTMGTRIKYPRVL